MGLYSQQTPPSKARAHLKVPHEYEYETLLAFVGFKENMELSIN